MKKKKYIVLSVMTCLVLLTTVFSVFGQSDAAEKTAEKALTTEKAAATVVEQDTAALTAKAGEKDGSAVTETTADLKAPVTASAGEKVVVSSSAAEVKTADKGTATAKTAAAKLSENAKLLKRLMTVSKDSLKFDLMIYPDVEWARYLDDQGNEYIFSGDSFVRYTAKAAKKAEEINSKEAAAAYVKTFVSEVPELREYQHSKTKMFSELYYVVSYARFIDGYKLDDCFEVSVMPSGAIQSVYRGQNALTDVKTLPSFDEKEMRQKLEQELVKKYGDMTYEIQGTCVIREKGVLGYSYDVVIAPKNSMFKSRDVLFFAF